MNIDAYMEKNPEVWRQFKLLAEQALDSGRKYFSARTIIEQIRWHSMISEKNSTFKIGDHVSPYLGRKLMAEDARFKGFFRTKTVAAEQFDWCGERTI